MWGWIWGTIAIISIVIAAYCLGNGSLQLPVLFSSPAAQALSFDQLKSASLPGLGPASAGTLVNGELDQPAGGYIKLGTDTASYATGDFNNDGAGDIAAIVHTSGGGSGDFYFLVVFLNDHGTPAYQSSIALGDRVDINRVTYSNGMFTVDIVKQGPNDPMCCPTVHEVHHFKIQNASLVTVTPRATSQ